MVCSLRLKSGLMGDASAGEVLIAALFSFIFVNNFQLKMSLNLCAKTRFVFPYLLLSDREREEKCHILRQTRKRRKKSEANQLVSRVIF